MTNFLVERSTDLDEDGLLLTCDDADIDGTWHLVLWAPLLARKNRAARSPCRHVHTLRCILVALDLGRVANEL